MYGVVLGDELCLQEVEVHEQQIRQPAERPGVPGRLARLALRLLSHLLQRVHRHQLRERVQCDLG